MDDIKDSRSSTDNNFFYKVIAGSFKVKENAENLVAALQLQGVESFLSSTTISGSIWYRVQTGAFSNRQNAEMALDELVKLGIKDAFMITENNSLNIDFPPAITILGETLLTPDQMNDFIKSHNPKAIELGAYYAAFGKDYGIKGDIAFAQALHETDFLRFTGVVQAEQNNFAGIGAIGGEIRGEHFASPEEGVLAHIQHLFAYSSTKPLPNKHPLVDPRFHLVRRGSAETWIDLNGKWAVPGDHYGQSILNLYVRMVNYVKKD